jgi:phosphoribosylamine--glycine ligase
MKRYAILGSGAREHAIAWKLSLEIGTENVFCLPGNTLIPNSHAVDMMNAQAVRQFCKDREISTVIIGPEAPLAEGVSDILRQNGLRVFGPSKEGAHLESSKIYSKRFMERHHVRTAKFEAFANITNGLNALDTWNQNECVVKFDGLAAGKGVFVCKNLSEAKEALYTLREHHGENTNFLIEEKLSGTELSLIIVTDGNRWRAFPFAQDHKRLGDGDRGPNTGGMGACAPIPALSKALHTAIEDSIVETTLNGIRKQKIRYVGFLYFGIMITPTGPYLLEYNARMGDPEAQALLATLQSPLSELVDAAIDGKLGRIKPKFRADYSACIVHCCEGYPNSTTDAALVEGLENLDTHTNMFFGGSRQEHGRVYAAKGRAFSVVTQASTPGEALQKAYAESAKLHFRGQHYRRDIGSRWLHPLPRNGEPARFAFLASGRGSNFAAILNEINNGCLQQIAQPVLLISDKAEAGALDVAAQNNIPSHVIEKAPLSSTEFESRILTLLRDYRADYVILAGFMRILSPRFVSEWRGRLVNIHPADTLSHKGLDGYQWAFEQQLNSTKITVHLVDDGVDTGPILAQADVDLSGVTSSEEVQSRGLKVEHKLFSATLADLVGQQL